MTREATKIINLPCLKEHNASGVTGCLKNPGLRPVQQRRAHARGPEDLYRPGDSGDVQRRAAAIEIGAAHHGRHPRGLSRGPVRLEPEFVWEAKTLLIGTDPVAVDRVELEIVEQKRREVGAPSLFDRNPANLGRSSDIERTAQKNPFYREPNHVRTASELGLGIWDLAKIDRRKIVVLMAPDTNWVTLLATNDRRGGVAAPLQAPIELIWKATLPDAVRSSPVLRDGVLYVACRDGRLYAFDAGNGRERWRYQAPAASTRPLHLRHSRALRRRRRNGVGGRSGIRSGAGRSRGRARWSSPTVDDDVYFGSTGGE